MKKVITFNSISFFSCEETFLLKVVLLSQQGRNPEGTNFLLHHLLVHIVPFSNLCCNFPDCHMLILSDELIDLSFVSVEAVWGDHCGTDQKCVPVLKMLYHLSNTASTHAGVSIGTIKSYVNIQCVDFLLKKFYHTHFQNDMSSSAIFAHRNMTLCWGRLHEFHSGV